MDRLLVGLFTAFVMGMANAQVYGPEIVTVERLLFAEQNICTNQAQCLTYVTFEERPWQEQCGTRIRITPGSQGQITNGLSVAAGLNAQNLPDATIVRNGVSVRDNGDGTCTLLQEYTP